MKQLHPRGFMLSISMRVGMSGQEDETAKFSAPTGLKFSLKETFEPFTQVEAISWWVPAMGPSPFVGRMGAIGERSCTHTRMGRCGAMLPPSMASTLSPQPMTTRSFSGTPRNTVALEKAQSLKSKFTRNQEPPLSLTSLPTSRLVHSQSTRTTATSL